MFSHLNKQKLENIAIIFTHTIKMLCRPTSIFLGIDIDCMYSKTILEVTSRTNIFLQAVPKGYQVDNVITITMNLLLVTLHVK